MRKIRTRSIKASIILLLIAGMVLSCVIFAFFSYGSLMNRIREEISDAYLVGLNTAGEKLERAFEDMHLCASKLTCIGSISDSVAIMLNTNNTAEYKDIYSTIIRELVIEDSTSDVIGRIDFFFPDSDSFSFLSNETNNFNAPKMDSQLYMKAPRTVYNIPRRSVSGTDTVLSLTRYVSDSDFGGYYLYMETDTGFLKSVFQPMIDHSGSGCSVCMTDTENTVLYSSDNSFAPVGSSFSDNGAEPADYVCLSYPSAHWNIILSVRAEEYNRISSMCWSQYAQELTLFVCLYFVLAFFLYRAAYDPLDAFIRELSENDVSSIYRNSLRKTREYNIYTGKIEVMRSEICRLMTRVEQESQQKAQLENELLLSRVNPHFMHNALSRISVLCADCNQPELASTVNSLNQLMYYNLGKSRNSTLRGEINALEDYIILSQGISFFRFTKHIDVPDAVLNMGMPRFILQPLAENCIKHNSSAPDLEISLDIFVDGDDLRIDLADNGAGMDAERLDELNRQLTSPNGSELGIGLAHVSAALFFGFSSRAQIRLKPNPRGGTTVEVTISLK